MTKKDQSSLRISSSHYRTADLIIAIAFIITAIVSGYLAIAHQVRDYWVLLIAGIIGAVLMLKRSRTPNQG